MRTPRCTHADRLVIAPFEGEIVEVSRWRLSRLSSNQSTVSRTSGSALATRVMNKPKPPSTPPATPLMTKIVCEISFKFTTSSALWCLRTACDNKCQSRLHTVIVQAHPDTRKGVSTEPR